MQIINKSKNTVLASEASLASTPLKRVKGLLGRGPLKPGEGLVIRPCNSVHTFFMGFPIDLLFIDKYNRVIKALSCLKSFRLSAFYFRSKLAIELPAGVIHSTSTSSGDIIELL